MKTRKNNPNHIAIIMDGNGTWSKKNKLQRKDGLQVVCDLQKFFKYM